MTAGELTLGAVLARLEEREREIAAQAEGARERIAELTALLVGFDTAAEEIRITRKTLLDLPDPQLPVPLASKLPDHPAYQQIMAVFAAADAPLRARAVCEAMDLEIAPGDINNVRLKLKRLAERGGSWPRASRGCSPCHGRSPSGGPNHPAQPSREAKPGITPDAALWGRSVAPTSGHVVLPARRENPLRATRIGCLTDRPPIRGENVRTSLPTPSLHTARLRLRALEDADANDLFELHSSDYVLRYWDAPPWSERVRAEKFITACRRMAQEGTGARLAVDRVSDGVFIGWCSLNGWNPDYRSASLGYCFDDAAWGQGYATEAARALLGWAFDTLDLNRVQAETDTRNVASARVLEKLGFVREGTLREDCVVNGEVSDSWVYGLIRREWQPSSEPVPAR